MPGEAQQRPPPIRCAHSVDRGDVLRLVRMGIPREQAGALCGFVVRVDEDARASVPSRAPAHPTAPPLPTKAPSTGSHQAPPLWRAIGPDLREPDPAERQRPACLNDVPAKSNHELAARTHAIVKAAPLAPTSRLCSLLRRMLTVHLPGAGADAPRLVRLLASLRPIPRLPRRCRRSWTPRLQVYWDQALALGPCLDDQMAALTWLRRWRGEAGLECIVVQDTGSAQWYPNRRRGQRPCTGRTPRSPDASTTLLALSDLGFANADVLRQQRWARLREQAVRAGASCHALMLCPRSRWQQPLARAWQAREWERSQNLKHVAEALEELFVLLSPAIRIEPGLLRAMRRLITRAPADLGVELDAWMDDRVVWRAAPLGMVLDARPARELQRQFRQLPAQRIGSVVKLLKHFHGQLSPNILAEERFACGDRDPSIMEPIASQAKGLLEGNSHYADLPEAVVAYLQRLDWRLPPEAWQRPELASLWALANRTRDGFATLPPEGLKISEVLWALEEVAEPTWWQLCQRGTSLHLVQKSEHAAPPGSSLAEFRLRLPQLELRWRDARGGARKAALRACDPVEVPLLSEPAAASRVEVIGDLGNAEVVLEPHPPWADRFWRDGSGLWVETRVRGFEWRVEEPAPAERSWFGRKAKALEKPQVTIAAQDLTTRLLWPTWATWLKRDEHGLFAEVDLAEKVVTRLRWIPPGRFLMGSPEDEKGRFGQEGPQHWVTLSKGYWLADAPCTQAEWQAVMGTTPSNFKGAPDLPVEQVSWEDCQAFCEKVQARFPGLQARLPSEAEWEYACRAGTASAFNDGSACTEPDGNDPALAKLGWFDKNSDRRTRVVCGLDPNQWGLHDMHGNVWEWCQDWFGNYAADEQQDPTGADSGRERVRRGGSWDFWAGGCRSASRNWWLPVERLLNLGFRLASGQSGQDSKPAEERAAGKLEGRRPDAPGGERAGKQKKGRK